MSFLFADLGLTRRQVRESYERASERGRERESECSKGKVAAQEYRSNAKEQRVHKAYQEMPNPQRCIPSAARTVASVRSMRYLGFAREEAD